MALVWIPPLLRDLTGGSETATVPGANVGQIIEALERQFPGVRGRLCPDGVLRPGLAVVVDGQVGRFGLLETVGPDSEVHFLPAIAGG
jgi:molybdopterin synthase sulfur carrier subunit